MSGRTFLLLFSAAAYLLGGIFGGAALILRSRARQLLKSAVVTNGWIVSLERSVSMSSEMVYPTVFPYFKFVDAQGLEHKVRSSVGFEPEKYAVGDTVEVTYNPADPQQASIDPRSVQRVARISIFAAALA